MAFGPITSCFSVELDFTNSFYRSRFPENPPVSFSIPDWQLKPKTEETNNIPNGETNIETNGETNVETNANEFNIEQNKQEQNNPDIVNHSQID